MTIQSIVSTIFNNDYPKIVIGKFGIKYLILENSALDFQVTKHGILDDWVAKNGSLFLKKDSIIFDVGANVGLLTLLFSKIYSNLGKIYSFEPDPINISQLHANIFINQCNNVQIVQKAIQSNHQKKSLLFNIRRCIDGDGKENRGISSLLPIGLSYWQNCS